MKPPRLYRRYSEEYRRRILAEADVLRKTCQVHELLAREGLCYQHLDYWRKRLLRGSGHASRTQDPKPTSPVPSHPFEELRASSESILSPRRKEGTADPLSETNVLDDYYEVSDGVSRLRQDLKEAEELKMRLEALISGEEEWAESLQRQDEQACPEPSLRGTQGKL